MTDAKRLDLYISQRAGLVRYARSLLDDPSRAEDIVHEAWLRVASAQTMHAPSDLNRYFFRAIRNLAFDIGRRQQFEHRHFKSGAQGEAETVADEAPGPESVLIAREKLRIVVEALEEMPENMRIAVEMHRFGKAKLKDIAERLNISVSAAHRLVFDGVEYCRERLERRSH